MALVLLQVVPFAFELPGLALKAWLYSQAIDGELAAGRVADLFSTQTLWPLLAAVAVALAARAWARCRR